MRKKIFAISILLVFLVSLADLRAQETVSLKPAYTRGDCFVIRPELYSGLFVEAGYQFNPYLQLTGGVGFGLASDGGMSWTLGGRCYLTPTKFAPFIDYHFATIYINDIVLFRNTLVAGLSYKNFDLGVGAMHLSGGDHNAIVMTATVGYNIRIR